MEKTKVDVMNHILIKLQDVQNSKKALIEKIASIQIELFEQPDAELEGAVDSLIGTISKSADEFNLALEQYQMKVNVENQSQSSAPATAVS